MKKLNNIALLAVIALFSVTAIAADRDPFMPYTWSSPSGAEGTKVAGNAPSANPLVDKPLSSYKVIGVVVSPSDALAVIKSRDRREYFAYIGDPVGMEGGVISAINIEGITIDMSGKVVPLKVSNRFENQDEKETETK